MRVYWNFDEPIDSFQCFAHFLCTLSTQNSEFQSNFLQTERQSDDRLRVLSLVSFSHYLFLHFFLNQRFHRPHCSACMIMYMIQCINKSKIRFPSTSSLSILMSEHCACVRLDWDYRLIRRSCTDKKYKRLLGLILHSVEHHIHLTLII